MKTKEVNALREEARRCFKGQSYEEAVIVLRRLGPEESWRFLSIQKDRDSWLSNSDFSACFWVWATNPTFSLGLRNPESRISLFIEFLKWTGVKTFVFCEPIDDITADALIGAIRYERLFLKDNWTEWLEGLELPASKDSHKLAWRQIKRAENHLWIEAQNALEEVKSLPPASLLAALSLAIEEYRYQESTLEFTIFLSSAYAAMMEYLLSESGGLNFSKVELEGVFSEFGRSLGKSRLKSEGSDYFKVHTCLGKTLAWTQYLQQCADHYAYNAGVEPVSVSGEVLLIWSPENEYRFRLDGQRYNFNHLYYFQIGATALDSSPDMRDGIPKGRFAGDKYINTILKELKLATTFQLDDLGVNLSTDSGVPSNEVFWIHSIQPFSINRKVRYETEVEQRRIAGRSFHDTMMDLTVLAASRQIQALAFEFQSVSEFKSMLRDASEIGKYSSLMDAVDLVIYKPRSRFDRFNLHYNPWETPFVVSGQKIYAPKFVVANNDWFYYTAQLALKPRIAASNRKKSATQVESNLADAFKAKESWKVDHIGDCHNSFEGDVDIIIGDGIDVCWIQVKRSSFRLTPYAKRSEELMSDFKANDQLLRAEVHFEDSPFLQTFGSPTMKWIVSTSFEGVNVENNGIIKFNYFELLRALKNPAIRNLVHLRDYLIHDTEIVHFGRGLLSKKVSDDFLAVMAGEYSGMELFGSPDCMKSVGILPGESAEHRYRMFNDAASLRESYGAREAISGFRRYVEQYPNDPEGWIELSNCFADTRQIDVAIEVLQKGLNLFPDCPVISRNLAICLGEKGMHAESLKCYFRILQKYPGLRQPFVEAKQIWYLGLSKALFPSNELVQLSEEASRLGLNEE